MQSTFSPSFPSARTAGVHLGLFALMFATGRFGQWLYYTQEIAPAVIWAPVGLALAAVFMSSNIVQTALVVVVAHAALTFTSPGGVPHPLLAVMLIFAYALQALLGAWVLRRWGFMWTFERTRDALLFLGVSLLIPVVSSTAWVTAQVLSGVLGGDAFSFWKSIWAGGVFSIIAVTPFAIICIQAYRARTWPMSLRTRESGLAALALLAVNYMLFWTHVPEMNVFLALYAFFAVFLWIGLRLGARALILALSLTSFAAVGGALALFVGTDRLHEQLFATELFIVLITPIFLIMASLVEERRLALEKVRARALSLEQSLAELADTDRSKNEFIAVLAHELRNPLAPVLSTIELLEMQTVDTQTAKHLRRVKHQTHVMRRLLDDLLDVARIAQHKFILQKQTVQIHDLVQHAIDATKSLAKDAGLELETMLPKDAVLVHVDPVRMQQTLTNLLNNAIKYTNRGGHIMISAYSEGRDALFVVADTGVGLRADERKAIFAPFHQGRAGSERPRAGTGLGIGLWLTRALVEEHGGTLDVESEGPGKGSTFRVVLRDAVLEVSEDVMADEVPDYRVREGAKRVLVVDDNEAAAQSLAMLLELSGYVVDVVHTGALGIERARVSQPDAVLLDIGLPDMSGYEVAQALKSEFPTIPLIALSGYGQEEDIQKGREAGLDLHLIKPVTREDVETALKRCWE